MELKDISDLLDVKIKGQTAEMLLTLEKIIDSKLEPIKNDISAIKNDLSNLRTHTDSINTRLSKLENRMSSLETKLDSVLLNTNKTYHAA